MLMSAFVQNIVDMIVDCALWVAVLKKEFSKIMEGRLYDCRNLVNLGLLFLTM